MYTLQRYGRAKPAHFKNVFIPILKEKGEYLHAEGVATAIWALSKAQQWDKETWKILLAHVEDRDFNYNYVKTQRWNIEDIIENGTNEHFFEKSYDDFIHGSYFRDDINLLEIHEGLKHAVKVNPTLEFEHALKMVEERYDDRIRHHEKFAEFE